MQGLGWAEWLWLVPAFKRWAPVPAALKRDMSGLSRKFRAEKHLLMSANLPLSTKSQNPKPPPTSTLRAPPHPQKPAEQGWGQLPRSKRWETDHIKILIWEFPSVAQRIKNLTSIHEGAGSGSDPWPCSVDWRCCRLRHGSQMRLGAGVAVAVV